MKDNLTEENIHDSTLSQVQFIISQKDEEETEDDIFIKYVTKIIFNNKNIQLKYPEIKDSYSILLIKFVDLI